MPGRHYQRVQRLFEWSGRSFFCHGYRPRHPSLLLPLPPSHSRIPLLCRPGPGPRGCFTPLFPLLGTTWPIVYFLQGRLGMAAIFTRAYWFVCPAIVSKHLWCEQPVKEIQLTSICYIQICVYSSFSVVSYSESIVDCVHSLTPPVPITISSSQSPLLSVTPVQCMDTANFINVKVRVFYSFSKHNIFSMKAKESFVIVWIVKETHLDNRQRVSSTQLSKTLTFASYTKIMQVVWGK